MKSLFEALLGMFIVQFFGYAMHSLGVNHPAWFILYGVGCGVVWTLIIYLGDKENV